jgi:HEAT repeat protein
MVTHRRLVFTLLFVSTLAAVHLSGRQTLTSVPPPEAGDLGAGWAHLSAGRAGEAAVTASVALQRAPRSLAAATLLVEAETMRGGAAAGLGAYERWLGSKPVEAPYLLRLVAVGALREAVRVTPANEAQRRAFHALYADGDIATLTAIRSTIKPVGLVERQMLGALGNEQAVRDLVATLRSLPDDRIRAINALRDTRSPLAVQALMEVLSDPLATNRMAAADALGQMGATASTTALRQMLTDPQFPPRFAAARALFKLGDMTAAPFLRDLMNSEHAMVRAQALEALASDPNGLWLSAVSVLLTDPDPMVRLIAARLAAPHDPAGAAAAAERLRQDENLAVRQAADRVYVEQLVTDFVTLRKFLRSADPVVRAGAAARILELTR